MSAPRVGCGCGCLGCSIPVWTVLAVLALVLIFT
jgi:hypothetical protein